MYFLGKGLIGIRYVEDHLCALDLIVTGIASTPNHPFAQEIHQQLMAYFANPAFKFSLPLKPGGSAHQTKVWQALSNIPSGQTRYYSELAAQLQSSPRAVGGACGANPIALIVPCHRVLAKSGLGGFMHQRSGQALDIKRWLLTHEQR